MNIVRTHVCLGLLLLSVMLCSCSRLKKEEPVQVPITVKVISATPEQGLRNSSYVGSVEPVKSVLISSRYPGTLVSLLVKQGDFVKQGTVVAQVVSSNVTGSYKMAQFTLQQAEDGYKRLMQVYKTGSIPDVKRVEVEAQLNKARAAFEAAAAAMEDGKLKAPFDGVVGEIFSDEGVELDLLSPVLRIMDISGVEIKFPVPEKEITHVKVGDTAFFSVPAMKDSLCMSKIKTKSVVASALSHSYECTLQPIGTLDGLLPGMVCKVYLNNELRAGMVASSSVVQMDAGGKYVWVVKDSIVEKRYVEVGGFYGKGVIITSGLYAGDELIVEGSRKVSTGMRVNTER